MGIAPGVRFGPYEVVSALGAGGMGEVYRARDTTLGRDVALKTLPEQVAQDPDRVARFRREAQILAALNHPLIASIYGVEDSRGTPVLVLELVEGPTLAERIDTGRLPLDETLRVAHQIAQALEAAHERGIVHRDLKPANVKLRPDGTVKVLDFGLARALDPILLYFLGESRGVFIGSIDGTVQRKLIDADSTAVFAPPGELLFVRDGVLYAQRFDPTRLQIAGDPVSVATGMAVHAFGGAAVSASAAGSIAYRSGPAGQDRQFVWVDRSGTRLGVVGKPHGGRPSNPALSPDGRRLAFSRSAEGNTDLWITDVDRGLPQKLTRRPTPDVTPVWAPDGRSILFSGITKAGAFELLLKSTTMDQEPGPLLATPVIGIAMGYSRDWRYVLYRQSSLAGPVGRPPTGWDIWAASMKDGKVFPVVETPSDDRHAEFSPDAEWIAYESNESGPYDIYVRPFPGPGASTRVSTAGGVQPQWRSDGAELFYIAPDGRLLAVPVIRPAGGKDNIRIGSPVALFSVLATSTVSGGISREYAVAPDGSKFLVNTLVELTTTPISLILNRKPLQ